MKRRWRTGAGFVAGALAAFAAMYALSEATVPVYADTRARVAHFREHSASLEAVSVGNSHSAALDFGALGMRGMHFWYAGADPFEAMFLARYAADGAPRLRYVLLTASYGFERLDNAVMRSADYTAIRRAVYLRAGVRHYIPGDRNLWIGARLAPVARTDQWSGVAARLAGRRRPPVRLTLHGMVVEPERPLPSADSLARYAPWQAGIHDARAAESLAHAPSTPARVSTDLDALARELGARGIVLVLYTPPYHHTYLREIAADVVEGTRRALQPVLRHPNVVRMDFSTHPAFTHRDALFRDSDHLNPHGAREFSALLRRCLDAVVQPGATGVQPPAGCPGAPQPVASPPRTAGAPAANAAAPGPL